MKSLLAHPEQRNERRDGDWRARGRKFRSEGRMRDARCWTDGTTDWHDGMASASPQLRRDPLSEKREEWKEERGKGE